MSLIYQKFLVLFFFFKVSKMPQVNSNKKKLHFVLYSQLSFISIMFADSMH